MTLSVLDGHLSVAGLFKWNISYMYAAFDKIWTDRARCAEFLVVGLVAKNLYNKRLISEHMVVIV